MYEFFVTDYHEAAKHNFCLVTRAPITMPDACFTRVTGLKRRDVGRDDPVCWGDRKSMEHALIHDFAQRLLRQDRPI